MSKIKSIIKKKIEVETLWNLAVEGDESYIADGVVVHNCRSLLIPITKYEDYKADKTTNDGTNIDKFIDDVTDKTGFSRFHVEQLPKEVEEKKRPEITDPLVDFRTESTSKVDVITYSLGGVDFQVSTITYENEEKKKVISAEHKRLDNDPKV